MSTEYDSYYGDETTLLNDETGNGHRRDQTRRSQTNVTVLLESKVHELESRNISLAWRIKALAILVMVLSVCSLATLIFCVVHEFNIEDLSDINTQVRSDQMVLFILLLLKSTFRLIKI